MSAEEALLKIAEGTGPDDEEVGVRVAGARWQDADDLARALGIETGSLYWHEMIERVRVLAAGGSGS